MKAISILGTSSNSGKSWFATALCALLRRRGFRVAPFKAQNMSNNSCVTPDGGEIGRAQAAQAEACGRLPSVEMNPILLKPSGKLGSQLVLLGQAQGHLPARDYYAKVPELWNVVRDTLEYWKAQCDVLVLEGAGSPVELNLMHRDLVNLRPVAHLDGRWILVADIERGGVFAQIVGTYSLLPKEALPASLGFVVNKFRGDLSLFSDAPAHFSQHLHAPYLGVLPFCDSLQPENEDSLSRPAEESQSGEVIAWVRFPHLSNSQDSQPWLLDQGIKVRWVTEAAQLKEARAIVLPGTKNTIADLQWLRTTGLADGIITAGKHGIPVVGICGGYQMLGRRLLDPHGTAGDSGAVDGLNLLPCITKFGAKKEVKPVQARYSSDSWEAYEIHMGRTAFLEELAPLVHTARGPEGCRQGKIWGTYLHGLFESAAMRGDLAASAGIEGHTASAISWRSHLQTIYSGMADLLEQHLDLSGILKYVES